MASEGGGGAPDLLTFVIAIVILGAIAEVGYAHLQQWLSPAQPAPQTQTATTTAAQ